MAKLTSYGKDVSMSHASPADLLFVDLAKLGDEKWIHPAFLENTIKTIRNV